MKQGIKKAVGSLFFSAGLIALLVVLSMIFIPKNNMKAFGMEDVPANGILGEKADTIDVVIVGDSESYSSFSPMQMWEQQGFTSYVCGTPEQYLYQSETFLEKAFENQKPSVVVLETNAIYRKMSPSAAVMNTVENMFSIFRYHDRWKSMGSDDFLKPVNYTWTDDMKGYRYNNAVDQAPTKEYMIPTDQAAPIEALNEEYVKNMAEFCRENGVAFLLVSTPSTVNWNYSRHNGIEALAKEYNIPYIDMNLMRQEIPIDWTKDTRDQGDHLNHSGAVKVSSWFGKFVKEKFSLKDRRQDSSYSQWNDALGRYKKTVGEV